MKNKALFILVSLIALFLFMAKSSAYDISKCNIRPVVCVLYNRYGDCVIYKKSPFRSCYRVLTTQPVYLQTNKAK